jgi:hypothetical protein
MSQDGLLRRKFLARRPSRPSLTVRLAAAAVCLLAAAAGIIVVAGGLVTRDDLMRQGAQELRGYAGQLARHPFLLTPLSRTPRGATGLSDLAGAGAAALSIQVRGASGQLIMRMGPGRPAGPGQRLAVTEPIHYRAHRIPYAYSAEDFTLDVTGPGGTGSPGTLVVSLSLARISQATGRLTAMMLAVSGLVVLGAGCLAAGMIRALLQPLTKLARRAEAVTAGRPWSGGLPESPRGTPDQATPALSATLARLEQAGAPSTGPGPATLRATERQRQVIADTSRELRAPLSVLDGLAEYYRHRDQLSAAGFGRLLARVAAEATRIGTLIDALERSGQDQPRPPGPDENVGGGA